MLPRRYWGRVINGGRLDERVELSRPRDGSRCGELSDFGAPYLLPLEKLSILLVPEADVSAREELFDLACAVEPLLEVVDCDQRFRFPTPSLALPRLSDRLCEAIWRRRASGDMGASSGKCVVFFPFALTGGREFDRPERAASNGSALASVEYGMFAWCWIR